MVWKWTRTLTLYEIEMFSYYIYRNRNVQLLHLQYLWVFLQIQCVGSICFDIVQKCIQVIVMCSLYRTYRTLSRTLMQSEIFLNREHKIQKNSRNTIFLTTECKKAARNDTISQSEQHINKLLAYTGFCKAENT